jgi:hypothetical protein
MKRELILYPSPLGVVLLYNLPYHRIAGNWEKTISADERISRYVEVNRIKTRAYRRLALRSSLRAISVKRGSLSFDRNHGC